RNARPSLKPTGVLAIGEWLPRDENSEEATTPKPMEAQKKEAGYRLDRIETFLKDNNLRLFNNTDFRL
ncbi:MAG: hypothetical protein WAU81_15320, partial [Candidatus Aminicenantales bacterium]